MSLNLTYCHHFLLLLHPSILLLPPSKPSFLLLSKTPSSSSSSPPLSLSSSSSSSINALNPSTTPIFLPHLIQLEQQQQQQQQQQEEKLANDNDNHNHNNPDDPIYKFFKTQSSIPSKDPKLKGKLVLFQKNRRTSWHLAQKLEQQESEPAFDDNPFNINKQQAENEEEEMGFLDMGQLPEGIVGEIVQLARSLPENVTMEEAMNGFEGKVSEEQCVEVLEILGKGKKLLVCCLYFFQWMRLQEPSLVSPRACTVLFPALGNAGMGDEIAVLFRNLPTTKEFRDVRVYNATLSGLLSSGRYEDAWKVYESMETDNILPDEVTCTVMIIIIRKLGRTAKDAWQFFEKMNRKGVRWSEEVLGALLKSFCVEGLMSEALIIQSEMEKKGVSSNAIIYNTLIDAYCKSNCVEEAEGLFVEMKAKGINPTESTFNILMHAYSKRMQPKIVEKLMAEMQDFGLRPTSKSYTSLISAYGKQKNLSDMAADAFLKMKKVGIKPTPHSYTALIHAYSVSGWHEKAYAAFENMQREGLKPSIETYTALLDAFRRAGDTETLMKIWKSMRSEKIEGTQVTFNTLVDGFAKQGHYIAARDVISEFEKVGLHPTVMTYNMLMNAYARGGQHLKLPQLLKEMEAHKLKPDSITYTTMIYAFVRVRDFRRAFFYHKKMVKSGKLPDVESYRKLRAILDVKALIKNKKDRRAQIGTAKKKMGILKPKGKKDEFWKYKKRNVRET